MSKKRQRLSKKQRTDALTVQQRSSKASDDHKILDAYNVILVKNDQNTISYKEAVQHPPPHSYTIININ